MRSDNRHDTERTKKTNRRKVQVGSTQVSRERERLDDWIRRDKNGLSLSFTIDAFAWIVLPNGRAGFAIARRQNMLHGFGFREEH